ncbi:MAG: helix-turn-helix domain-containing protein [Pseudomonadota bacterium]
MKRRPRFEQYCPLAIASEILSTRWTMLILRELMEGSTSFNDISRGVPRMSRSLLATRLKDLSRAGLISRQPAGPGRPVDYRLTAAGQSLAPILRAVAEWGQEWLDVDSSLDDDDTDFLMWDVRRNIRLPDDIGGLVIQFVFPDAPEDRQLHWLVADGPSREVGFVDPGLPVDVTVEAALADFKRVWMGWLGFEEATARGLIAVEGPAQYVRDVPQWLGLSSVSHIAKQPEPQRVLRYSA